MNIFPNFPPSMQKNRLYILSLFILISSFIFGQDFKPTINTLDSIYSFGNGEKAKTLLLQKIIRLEQQKGGNSLLLSRHYNLLGEIFHYSSDIGKAHEYWTKSFNVIKRAYGLNSIYMAENYTLLARYYNFRIKIDSAFYFAQKSIIICNSKKDSLHLVPVHKIYREYAYAGKIYWQKENFFNSRAKARMYFDSANYFNELYFQNRLYNAQIFQDIGNTHTDETLFNSRISPFKNPAKAKVNFKRANSYYDKALSISLNEWGNKHEKIAALYFVKGLSYTYCYGGDSIISALNYYQKGLCALSPEYYNTSILSIPNPNYHFNNPALALTLLRNKVNGFYDLYQKTKDINYLKYCYQHSLVAVELWENTFKNFKTHEIHQALEVYGASPFASIIPRANEYYQLTKSDEIKQNVFRWMDLNKYSVLLKYQLENNEISFKSNNATTPEIQNKLEDNEAIIEYYLNDQELTCAVISKRKFDLFPSNRTFKISNKVDMLIMNLGKHNAEEYCKIAKVLYDSILNPYIKNLPKEINHLIIIPHGKLSQVPFDALVLNQTNKYSKADFLIKHYNISYALSCNLFYNNKENNLLKSDMVTLSPEYKQHSNLPFSKKVIDELRSSFSISNFVLSNTSKNSSILHISAHACCDYQNSRNSYILLSDTQKLFLNEISNKKFNSKLAILNACETANGDIEMGEGVINFSRHFYLAGIKSTITTIWKVDDEATANTISFFYKELQRGNSTVTSLYNAKLNYLNTGKSIDDYDPYYWAGLIYTGNDLVVEKNKTNYVLYTISGIVILGLGIVLLLRQFHS